MEIKIYTDGGAINNPGQAAISYLIYTDGNLTARFSRRIGINTNNFAEYSALIAALEKTKEISGSQKNITQISVYSDSSLMVNQLNGLFKVKNPAIRELVMKTRILEQEINIPIIYKYIPREKNQLADSLIKKELSFRN